MKFISEETIEHTLKEIETGKTDMDQALVRFKDSQPFFFQFLSTENFNLLKEEEFDHLLFILLTIFSSIEEDVQSTAIEASRIEEVDEKNWSIFNSSKTFNKAKDAFFESYRQEDLLAYVEDSLVEDEDDFMSQVGREVLFITAKSMIDCLEEIN